MTDQGPPNSPPSGLLAGVARADISPPIPVAHLNWGSQTHIEAEGIDPTGMFVTALAVSDGEQKFVMVDLDAILTLPFEPAIEQASRRTGIPTGHIRLGVSHTHAGPRLVAFKGPLHNDLSAYQQVIEHYEQGTIDKIVGVIVEADSKLQPAHLYGGRGTGTININRRVPPRNGAPPAVGINPDGFVDRELVVFRIDSAQGNPYAVLLNFQCHGTVLSYANKLVSPDWVGMTRKVVEQVLPGATCLFFQGAAGNQGPKEGFTGDLSVAHRLGTILGHQAASVALEIETVQREPIFEGYVESTAYLAKQPWRVKGPRDATLRFASKVIELPRRTFRPEEIAEMERRVADAEKKMQAARETGDSLKRQEAEARWRRLNDQLMKWKDLPHPELVRIGIQILRIGDGAIVSMPGEPFAEIGAAIKKASPFAVTMFCAYSTGFGSQFVGDYMPAAGEYEKGGYEIDRTRYDRNAPEKLIAEARSLFEEVK